jgi:hypothetical protein
VNLVHGVNAQNSVRQDVPANVAARLAQHRGPDLNQRRHCVHRDVPVDAVLHRLGLGDRVKVHGEDRHAGYSVQDERAVIRGNADAVDLRPPPGQCLRVGTVHY